MSNLHLVGACYPRRRQCHLRFKWRTPKRLQTNCFSLRLWSDHRGNRPMAAAPRKKHSFEKTPSFIDFLYIMANPSSSCLPQFHVLQHGIQLKCPLVWLRFLCRGSWARWALAFLESRRLLSCGEIEIHTKADPKDCQAPATLSLNWVVGSRPLTFPGCSDN